jgi:uncharacterized protein DUF3309
MLLYILIAFLVLALLGGGWGHTRGFGYMGWSPLGLILVVLVVLLLMGRLH